jgi:hypothetical protein
MKSTRVKPFWQRGLAVLRSKPLFWVLFGVFVFEALWIAFSGSYSMAFDEYVHFGMIKIFAHQWLPFFAHQPAGADAFGAVARDPSYLYHYLMSFPYRLVAHFVPSFMAQIIFLRLCSIAFFAGGLLLYRRAFQRGGVSPLVQNLSLGFLLLLPVTPFMAAQVNYDTALFLLVGATIYVALGLVPQIGRDRLPLNRLLLLAAIAMTASLVKYAYLPILLGLTICVVVWLWRRRAISRRSWRAGLDGLRSWRGLVIVLFFILSLGLFVERYGVNVVRYHTPTPECNQVMALDKCMAYEPFARNYNYHAGHYALPAYKVAVYPFNNWMRGMLRSLFFVVANKESGYRAGEPIGLAHAAGYAVLVGGLVLVLARLKWLWRQGAAIRLFLVLAATYSGLLFLQNFMDFLHTAVPVAIQGRYLMPILPLFLVLVGLAAVSVLRRFKPAIGFTLLAALIFMMLQGGGLGPFLLRSHDGWLWNAPVVRTMNDTARNMLSPFVIRS